MWVRARQAHTHICARVTGTLATATIYLGAGTVLFTEVAESSFLIAKLAALGILH
jgi:hypothetical protein